MATTIAMKSLVRRMRRRVEVPQHEHLNIYPMMDMMTILLVFMIMQFAASSADLVPSSELDVPWSTSAEPYEPKLAIQISRTEVAVDGVTVLRLHHGRIDAIDRGGATGFLVPSLHRVLRDHRERLAHIDTVRGAVFGREVSIVADRSTPFRTLSEVLYTLGQAGFDDVRFAVLPKSG